MYDSEVDPRQQGVAFIKGQHHNQVPIKHYSRVNFGLVDVFLMDTRKERNGRRFLSNEQQDALEAFLSDKSSKVKFILSSVTFLADKKGRAKKADNWKFANKQRLEILDYIRLNRVKNVFFLSGDVHSNFAASLKFNDQTQSVHQLVSGSLFWPTSFLMNRIRWYQSDVKFDKKIKGTDRYKLSPALSDQGSELDFFTGNAVGHIDIVSKNGKPDKLVFTVFCPKGNPKIQKTFRLA